MLDFFFADINPSLSYIWTTFSTSIVSRQCNEKGGAMESIDERKNLLEQWLAAMGKCHSPLQLLPGDASFRRYFRTQTVHQSWIVMDAPPAKEDCRPFIAIANALRQHGLNTPEIIAANTEQGFLLLSDFGDRTYLKSLHSTNADRLYRYALQALSRLQACPSPMDRPLPRFTGEWLQNEWQWHKEWFVKQLLGVTLENKEESLLNECYQTLMHAITAQPYVFMHRDFHSANLMVLPNAVGILDFQDAFIGPVTYDLASLLRDCYIHWPEAQVLQWVSDYKQLLHPQLNAISEAEFIEWFDKMSVQRHLKALFTFARKAIRDQQSQYLQHVPRTLDYLMTVTARYAQLAPLHDFLKTRMIPACEGVLSCVQ